MSSLSQQLFHPNLLLAAVLSALFALISNRLKLVSLSGAIATFVVGFVIYGLGGALFTIPLFAFFITSSALSRIGKQAKSAASKKAVKGATRDAWQVLANGGAACLIVIGFYFTKDHVPTYLTRNLLCLYLAALATVNADTWATEIGGLSKTPPRLLKNWKPVEPGASGAISGLGLLASLCGSVIIPLSVYFAWKLYPDEVFVVVWAGFLGAFADSILGASVQALYRDAKTQTLTERTEIDGKKTDRVSGFPWINNDVVNFAASLIGVLCAWLMLKFR